MTPPVAAAIVFGVGAGVAAVSWAYRRGPRTTRPADDAYPDPIEDADTYPSATTGVRHEKYGTTIGPADHLRLGGNGDKTEVVIYEGERVFSPLFGTAGWPFKPPPYQKADGTWWQPTHEQTWESADGSKARTWGRPIADPRSS